MTSDTEQRIRDYLDAREPWAKADGWSFVPDGISRVGDPYDVQLNESDLRDVLAQLAETRGRLTDYENRITWHTTCGQCSRTLDAAYRETVRAERAEARVAGLEARAHATSQAVEQRARAEDATGIAPVYCAWWDASALVDETLGLGSAGGNATRPTVAPSCAPTPNALICACGGAVNHPAAGDDDA